MNATRDAIKAVLPKMGEQYKNIVVLDADLGSATRLNGFKDKFPERFFQIGIAEANMVGIASGLSEYGYKVFLGSFASFLTGRYDYIKCSLAYSACKNIVLIGTHVGMAIGKDGVTQMGLEDVSLMRALPNMKILNPATYSEAIKIITYLCENELDCPHYLRLGRQPLEDLDIDFQFGKAQIIKKGSNITVFSTGCMLTSVLDAVNLFEKKTNYTARVVHFSTIKPIDSDMIVKCAKETKHLFSVEDHTIIGGFGSAVSEVLTDQCPKKLNRIGLIDVFPESGDPKDLYEKYGLSPQKICDNFIDKIKNYGVYS